MSDSKGGSNEPSMEEILASIRRIIDEDTEQAEKGGTGPGKARSSSSALSEVHWPEDREAQPPEREEEVLELTQLVNEDGSVTDLSEGSVVTVEPVVVEEESRQEEPREESDEAQRYDEPQSVVQSHHEPAPAKAAGGEDAGEEDDGKDELRAATEPEVRAEVQAWLDRNLPEMVERIVREEVERMLRRLKDD